jgi:hypothetical protein
LIRRVKLKSNSTPGNKVTIYDVQQATIGINVDGYAGLDLGNPNSSITVVSGPQVPAYLVALVGSPTGGTYTLTVTFQGGVTVGGTIGGATSNIAYNANAATIQAALRNVPGCGNVTVTGTLGSGFTVTFPDTFDSVGNSGVTVTINASGLTGGTYSLNQTLSSATCQWYVLARDPGDRLWHGVAASFTCPACEAVYGFDLSAAGYTATLPTVNLYKGLRIGFVVEKIVSSGPPNSLTISGAPSGSPAIFANLNSFIFYEYDGTQWQVVGISAGNEMYTGLAANFTAPACQAVYGMDCSAASRTVTMPSTNLYVGLRIGFTVQKNTALPYANSLTISGLGTVPGGYLNILYGLGYFIFEYDGTQWNVVSIRPASEATEVANSALQSVPTGTPTPLVANTALGQQLFGSWAIGPTPSRLISIQGGIVSITASVSFPSVAAGSLVQVYLRKNGSTQYPIVTPTHTVQTSEVPNGVQMSLAITTSVSIGDYFEVIGLHNLGSAHPVQLTEFSMSRLGA